MKISKLQVPKLIVPRHPLWVMAYEAAWDLLRYADARAWQTDPCMLALWARYGLEAETLYALLAPVYEHWQAPEKFRYALPAWAEREVYRHTGDKARVAWALPHLLAAHAARKAQHIRANGLYAPLLAHAGAQTSPRDGETFADVSAQQAHAWECMGILASAWQGESMPQTVNEYLTARQRIHELCWDESAQFYFDVRADGSRSNVQVAENVAWSLLAGIPTHEQAQAIAQQLSDPRKFWRVHVFPCLAADHPRYVERGAYWRGSVWPPINYALIKGLQRYGLHGLAFRAADNHLTNISQVYKETRSHWENYMPDSVEPGSIAQPDFVAWAGLASVALLIEVVMGVEVYAPDQRLSWHPCLRETHGLEGLRCGNAIVNLEVTAPFVGATELQARLTTTAPIRLQVNTTQGAQWFEVWDEWAGSLVVRF